MSWPGHQTEMDNYKTADWNPGTHKHTTSLWTVIFQVYMG